LQKALGAVGKLFEVHGYECPPVARNMVLLLRNTSPGPAKRIRVLTQRVP
jgi:hypothetical protein